MAKSSADKLLPPPTFDLKWVKVVGICGGEGVGKSTLCSHVKEARRDTAYISGDGLLHQKLSFNEKDMLVHAVEIFGIQVLARHEGLYGSTFPTSPAEVGDAWEGLYVDKKALKEAYFRALAQNPEAIERWGEAYYQMVRTEISRLALQAYTNGFKSPVILVEGRADIFTRLMQEDVFNLRAVIRITRDPVEAEATVKSRGVHSTSEMEKFADLGLSAWESLVQAQSQGFRAYPESFPRLSEFANDGTARSAKAFRFIIEGI